MVTDYDALTQQPATAVPDGDAISLLVAAALYDFGGWLTSRSTRLTVSATDNASPMADAINQFCSIRGVNTRREIPVLSWQDWLAAAPAAPVAAGAPKATTSDRFDLCDGSGALVVYADDYDTLAQRCRDLELNHAMLRDELESEQQSVAAFRKERDALRAEVEALRKDAERYRWLRDHGATCRWEEGDTEVRNHPGLLDEAVDESITKANGGEA